MNTNWIKELEKLSEGQKVHKIEGGFTREELENYLGVSRQTASKYISHGFKQGLIMLAGHVALKRVDGHLSIVPMYKLKKK